jgi:mRNA interferase MazF
MQSSSPALVKPLDVLDPGDMYWGEDADARGSEQKDDRLWVVMSRRSLNGNNTIVVVPATTKVHHAEKHPAFCIRLPAQEQVPILGQSASRDRVALCHQVRVFDKSRLREKWGKLSLSALPAIQLGLAFVFDIR